MVLAENSPCISWFPHVLWTEALIPFVLDYLFKNISVANSLGRQKLCSLTRKGHAWFLSSIIKQWNCLLQKIWFPWTQGFSSLTQLTAHAEGVTWPSSHCLYNFESRTWCENYDTLAVVTAVSSKLPFVPDPGVLALLPASLKTCVCASSVIAGVSDSLRPHGLQPVHGVLQAGILSGVAMPFSRGSSQSRDQTLVSYVFYIVGRFFTCWAIR